MNQFLSGFEKCNDRSLVDSAMSRNPKLRQYEGHFRDSAVSGGWAFLEGQLEKLSPTLNEPTTAVFWDRDIPVNFGGGFSSFSSAFFVDYADTDTDGTLANATSEVAEIQANVSKDLYKVFNVGANAAINFFDMKLLEKSPFSQIQVYTTGVNLKWNKALDNHAFVGKASAGTYGLINSPLIPNTTAAATGTGSSTNWSAKTGQQIQADINAGITATALASNYDNGSIADTLLLPPAVFNILLTPYTIGGVGFNSLLEYIKLNNFATANGIPFNILPNPRCNDAGASGTQRGVYYRRDPKHIVMDVPVKMQKVLTVPEIGTRGASFVSHFAGQIGELQIKYPQSTLSQDGL